MEVGGQLCGGFSPFTFTWASRVDLRPALSLTPQFLFLLRQDHPWSHVFWLLYFFLFNVFYLFLNISLIFLDFFSKSLFFSQLSPPSCFLLVLVLLFSGLYHTLSNFFLAQFLQLCFPQALGCTILASLLVSTLFCPYFQLCTGWKWDEASIWFSMFML